MSQPGHVGEYDLPHLETADGVPMAFRCLSECIKGPDRGGGRLIGLHQRFGGAFIAQLARRGRLDQGDDLRTLLFADAPGPAASLPIAQAENAVGVETVQALPHRPRVTTHPASDLRDRQT